MARQATALVLLFGALLSGCTVGPDYKLPDVSLPDSFVSALITIAGAPTPEKTAKADAAKAASADTPVDLTTWWRALGDPEIDSLVGRAIQGNFDLGIALARLQEARTQEAVVLGTALPSGEVSGADARGTGSDLTRGRVSPILTSADTTSALGQITQIAGFDAGWELDLFGKYRREMEAAKYDSEAAAAARNSVLVAVVADTVRAYVDLRALQTQLAIQRQNIAVVRNSYDVVRQRFERGITNELDVTLARRELDTLQAGVAPLMAQIAAARYAIALLLGQLPDKLEAELAKPAMIPDVPSEIAPGLPLDLLRRRPDIHEAERELAADTARIGVATADLFPHILLTGAAGIQGAGAGFAPSTSQFVWSAGPSAYWNILDFGTLDALVDIADLRTHEQSLRFRRTVIDAVRDVDADIADFAAQQNRVVNLSDGIEAAQRAVNLASERYDRGLTDFLNVLDAERQEYALEQQFASARQIAADDFVALFRALGGGWENYQSIPPVRQPQPAIIAAFNRLLEKPSDPAK
jgi:NodT family efflux transporter outer membrane factor (OMF) lipoprotein